MMKKLLSILILLCPLISSAFNNEQQKKIHQYTQFMSNFLAKISPDDRRYYISTNLNVLNTNQPYCARSSSEWFKVFTEEQDALHPLLVHTPAHWFLVDHSLGKEHEIIIDGTYRQFLDLRHLGEKQLTKIEYEERRLLLGLPEVFVGTREDLTALYRLAPYRFSKDFFVNGTLVNALYLGAGRYIKTSLEQTIHDAIEYYYYFNRKLVK